MRRQKKTIVKRIAAVGMGLCMSMSMCMTGYASDANSVSIVAETSVPGDAMITPMSIDARKSVSLDITSGVATATAKSKGTPGEVTKISVTLYLQKKTANGSYATIKRWSGSAQSNYYNIKRMLKVSKGTYRVKARITCYKGSKSETSVKYSSVRIYR